MKIRVKKRLQGYMGLVLLLSAIVGLFYWEYYGRDTFLSDEIIVLKQDVKRYDPIEEDMLIKVKRPKESLSIRETFNIRESQIIYDEKQILGLIAKHYVPEGQPLVQQYFIDNKLLPGKDQYTFNIPRDWIMALPGSLRRGDDITLYPFLKDEERLIKSLIQQEGQSEDELAEDNMIISNEESLKELLINFEKELKTFPFVATHIKDGSNKEVISVDLQEPEDLRFDASSNIREIEILTTKEEVDQMKELVEKGYVFIVMYQ